jgi:hypothetical protein
MMRGEREIALTTPVSLTAFQPSLWDGSSLLRFQAFHAWLRSQVPTGQNPTGTQGYSVLPFHGKGLSGRHVPPITFRTYCGMACAGTPPASTTRRSRPRIPRQYFRGNRPIPMMTSWLATKASSGPNAWSMNPYE